MTREEVKKTTGVKVRHPSWAEGKTLEYNEQGMLITQDGEPSPIGLILKDGFEIYHESRYPEGTLVYCWDNNWTHGCDIRTWCAGTNTIYFINGVGANKERVYTNYKPVSEGLPDFLQAVVKDS